MRIPRVYADTSVFGGAFDEEFQEASKLFFEQVRKARFILVTSALVDSEVQFAPEVVREFYDEITGAAEIVEITDDATELQVGYITAGIVGEEHLTDALHVALATVAGCSVIVSFNFRHIVNFRRIPLYNAVNALHGYPQILIHSPQEVSHVEDENEDF